MEDDSQDVIVVFFVKTKSKTPAAIYVYICADTHFVNENVLLKIFTGNAKHKAHIYILYIRSRGRVTDVLYTCRKSSFIAPRPRSLTPDVIRYLVIKNKNKEEILSVLVFAAIVSGITMIIAAAAATAVDLRLLQMH